MKTLTLLALAAVLVAPHAQAQDSTPPVLLDFTISPVVFDTTTGVVSVEWCLTVQDDLSGLSSVGLNAANVDNPDNRFGLGGLSLPSPPTASQITGCRVAEIPAFFAFGTYAIAVQLYDASFNRTVYAAPSFPLGGTGHANLCLIGPCEMVNQPLSSLPDFDLDGVADIADNCPEIPNDQFDSDLDLIGDACDPFPSDRDNEQAQCDADLDDAIAELDECLVVPAFRDEDGDGEADVTDLCSGTFIADVDSAGCSLTQFCNAIDVSIKHGSKACRSSDWRNDEPLGATDCQPNNGQCQPR